MPIFRIKGKLVYYAHVPKAGGSSVADYFESLGASTAFTFGAQWKQRPRDRWSSTSPQHIDAGSLSELFPSDFFDACFTVVRHPEDRIISEYKFRVGRSRVHAALSLSDWLHVVISATKANPFAFDGHARRQHEFLPEACKVFKLEEGLQKLGEWLPEATDLDMSFPEFRQHSNRSKAVTTYLCQKDRALINDYYSADFDRFEYEQRSPNDLPKNSVISLGKGRALGTISSIVTRTLSSRLPY